jgi:hypothetical protein
MARFAEVAPGARAFIVDLNGGVAVRARSRACLEAPGDLHDPRGAAAAYEISARILQL